MSRMQINRDAFAVEQRAAFAAGSPLREMPQPGSQQLHCMLAMFAQAGSFTAADLL